jgi:hypothetical protein
MTYSLESFSEYTLLQEPIDVNTANGACIQAIGQGTIPIQVAVGSTVRTVALTEVLYVPQLAGSLISVLQLQDKGITIRTTIGPEGKSLLIERQGVIIGVADLIGKQYALNSAVKSQITAHSSFRTAIEAIAPKPTSKAVTTVTWHRRFGHLGSQSLQGLHTVTIGLSEPIGSLKEPCEACILTKSVRVVNRKGPERTIAPLQRLHMDFWGPYSVPSLGGYTYMLTITDDYSRKSWVRLTNQRKVL